MVTDVIAVHLRPVAIGGHGEFTHHGIFLGAGDLLALGDVCDARRRKKRRPLLSGNLLQVADAQIGRSAFIAGFGQFDRNRHQFLRLGEQAHRAKGKRH